MRVGLPCLVVLQVLVLGLVGCPRPDESSSSTSSSSGGGGTSSSSGNNTSSGTSQAMGSSSRAGSSSAVVGSSSRAGSSSVAGSSAGSGVSLGSSSGVASSSGPMGSSSGAVTLSSSQAGSSSSGGPAMVTASELRRQQGLAICAFQARCAAVRGQLHTSEAGCAAQVELSRRQLLLATGYDQDAQEDALFLPVDGAAFQTCMQGYATLDCRAELLGLCEPLLRYANTLSDGEACGRAANGAVCDPQQSLACIGGTVDACMVCAPIPPRMPCTMDAECATNHCELGVCYAPRKKFLHEVCTPGQCLPGLNCVLTAGINGTCEAPLGAGAPCGSGPLACALDLQCLGTCQPFTPDGQPCARNGGPRCEHACQYPAADSAVGTCTNVTQPPAPGEPCLDIAGCGGGLFEAVSTGNGEALSCTCLAKKATGDACDLDYQCASGHCLAVNGACGPLRNVGETCRVHEDCATSTCLLQNGATAPTCQANLCMAPPVDCSTPPPNVDRATAVVLTAGQAASGVACPGVETFFVLPGPFGAEATFRTLVMMDEQQQHIVMNLAMDGDYAGSLAPAGDTNGSEAGPARLTAFADSADAVVVRVSPVTGEPGFRFHVLVQQVGTGGDACAVVPTNTSTATAVTLPPGTPTPGTFCSQSANREFYWRVPGPLPMGATVTLNAVFDDSQDVASLNVVMFDFPGGMEVPVQQCFFARAFPDCSVMLPAAVPELFIRTEKNPTVDDRQDFTWTVTVQ